LWLSSGFLLVAEQKYVLSIAMQHNILTAYLGGLLPRKGRRKPGSFGEDQEPGVAGEAGKYGCMAVDNVYNVLHFSDRKFFMNISAAARG
jgi:hypothetical protein